ncbi:MAG: hypothetical protein H0W83_08345 [Planctomycetes bacterium]|nr:hypothetical protein [Planctomycetota bacterium]
MIIRPLAIVFTLALTAGRLLASDAVDNFTKAMAGNDSTEKRAAVQTLAGAPDDEVVLPLLVQAVADRQAGEAAILALRARTGLKPAVKRGQSHYPNYPSGDSPTDWSTWLAERGREKAQEKTVKDAEKMAKEAKKTADKAKKKADGKVGKDGKDDPKDPADQDSAEEPVKEPVEDASPKKHPIQAAPEDLGKVDRIVFKNGSSLVCYILTRRTDADGNLLSVRVVHPDGAGEEILDAALIARIEEDIK